MWEQVLNERGVREGLATMATDILVSFASRWRKYIKSGGAYERFRTLAKLYDHIEPAWD